MTNRRLSQAVRRVLRAAQNFIQNTTKAFVLWVLRGLLLYGRQPATRKAGFVLPTTVLLLLVLTLTVGAITLRTYNRTEQTIGERDQRVVYNAATPAIDRAKAKLEYLFNRQRDPRLPSGIPGEPQLWGMLVNDGRDRGGLTVQRHLINDEDGNPVDPYTFPDETTAASVDLGLGADMDVDGDGTADRLDLDGDGLPDNAWAYRTDLNSDGTDDATVAYSIVFRTPADPADMELASDAAIQARADVMQVRHGPLSNTTELSAACQIEGNAAAASIEAGWFTDEGNSSILRKNFQVDAYILPDDTNGTVSTVEFHQDRQLAKGNKWGAWFRNDLEIFPGPEFNWNGAMHTEGNLVVGNTRFNGYLVSSPASCLYTRDASEITVADVVADPDNGIPAFQAQVMSGKINDNSFGGRSDFHLFGNPPVTAGLDNVRLDRDRDSVGTTPRPTQYALDPIALVTRDVSMARGIADPSTERDNNWADRKFVTEGRIYNQSEDAPYLDDFYRADNRYGPKPRVSKRRIPGDIGEPITGDQMAGENISDDDLTNLDASDPRDVGLDGYWERRATRQGAKLIVGQRLELGNAFGWGVDLDENGVLDDTDRQAEPLYPAESCPGDRCHESLQRRTLYDNLAAVQSLAVYHSSHENGGDFPAACYAFTAHPGSAETIKSSRTFEDSGNGFGAYTDFLNGKGTNGWEFDAPGGFSGASAEASFASAIADDQPLGIALRNLAHFAGDPQGGAPSFTPIQEVGGNTIHPYPNLTMWGDYSMLRRVLAMLDGASAAQGNPTGGAVAYANLSPADKATLHTAACMMGMLGHNAEIVIDRAERAINSLGNLTNTGQDFVKLIDSNPNNGDINDIFIEQTLDNGDPNPYYDGRFTQPEDYYDDWVASGQDEYNEIEEPGNPGTYYCAPGDDDTANFDFACDIGDYANQFTVDQYIIGYSLLNNVNQAEAEEFREFMTQLLIGYQLLRDRAMGFADGFLPNLLGSESSIGWDEATGYTARANVPGDRASYKTGCDPNIFSEFTGVSAGGGASNRDPIAISVAICGESLKIRYPSLYYLLPVYNHDHLGTGNAVAWDDQPDFEEYVADTYIFDPVGTGVNDTYTYEVVGDDDGDGVDEQDLGAGTGESSIESIALTPHALNFGDWVLPVNTTPGTTDPNLIYSSDAFGDDYDSDRMASVPLLDKGIFNGRELIGTRVLDIDWGLLHDADNSLGNDADGNTDHWLPNSGIFYAFREDAVREDGIVRPRNANWDACDANATYERTGGPNNARCRMKADPNDLQDPPLNSRNNISPKAVDYYPDPDRRPNGFRFFNGAKLNRPNDDGRGLTFVADTPVYIKGHFNWHQTTNCNETNGCRLEEFQTKLQDNFNNFYSRNNLDTRFARRATDLWRPSEILADAVSVVSERLCDGSIEDYFVTAGNGSGARIGDSENRYGCNGNGDRTTYLNATRPSEATDDYDWLRANSLDDNSPVVVSRNGMPMIVDDADSAIKSFEDKTGHDADDFYSREEDKPLNTAEDARINAIIISGLVPSRDDQAYGGMHNFPRFLEDWNRLYISGSLLQLNFSNYATAPFDQDAWETDENTISGRERIRYYSPPNRLWGYDVGLQYAPAGPIAERFVTPQSIRSEFYSEPPADDQYMINLCRQIADDPDTQCADAT